MRGGGRLLLRTEEVVQRDSQGGGSSTHCRCLKPRGCFSPSKAGLLLPIGSLMSENVISLRYPATCLSCGTGLPRGAKASWNHDARVATCVSCITSAATEKPVEAASAISPDLFDLRRDRIVAAEMPVAEPPVAAVEEVAGGIDRGKAGGSAAREWQRRHDRRERQIRARYGRLGRVVSALTDDPHSTAAWAYGANGEAALGRTLDPLREQGVAVMHDRRMPGSRANIDHIAVGPGGVYVIDAKNYKGRVEKRDRGGFFSSDYRLYVGSRDQTPLVAGMAKQVEAVRDALGEELAPVQICRAICFVTAEWSLFARPFEIDGVHVLWPKALVTLLSTPGNLEASTIATIERRLILALPAA
jgi:hypothetical protein